MAGPVAGDFKPLLRRAGVASEHLINCAVGISGRTHVVGALDFTLGPGTTWHFHTVYAYRKKATDSVA
jgi:hypothetical protein